MGTTLSELLGSEAGQVTHQPVPPDFTTLANQFRDIDQSVLPVIRDLRISSKMIEDAYLDLVRERLRRKRLTLALVDRALHERQFRDTLITTLSLPDLTIDVSHKFERVTFSYSDDIVLEVESPDLLWDCHCRTPSNGPSQIPCPIHADPSGAELTSRFHAGFVLIRYRGLGFYWRRGPELWPPSVDSFSMIEDLEQQGLFTNKYERVLDLGAGTGFLGVVTAALNPHVLQVDFSDWLLTPFLYSITNWVLNSKHRRYVEARARLGLFTSAARAPRLRLVAG